MRIIKLSGSSEVQKKNKSIEVQTKNVLEISSAKYTIFTFSDSKRGFTILQQRVQRDSPKHNKSAYIL